MFVPLSSVLLLSTHTTTAFVAMMWTAILTVQAGAFLQCCIEAIWPSFKRFPNHLPLSANIDCTYSIPHKDNSLTRRFSCWSPLLLPLLVSPNRPLPYADRKTPRPLLDQRCRCSTHLFCSLPLGRYCYKGWWATSYWKDGYSE